MIKTLKLLFVAAVSSAAVLFVASCSQKPAVQSVAENDCVNLIFDTDMAPDYDDVGALAILHCLADSGEVRILGTASSNRCATAVPCIEVINTYFGRPEIPVACVRGDAPDRTTWHNGDRWTEILPQRFPHTIASSADAEDATVMYRRVLAQQPDSSVTIVSVGFLSNMSNLISSQPDSISPLAGIDLVRQKVRRLVVMGGAETSGREFNLITDSIAAQNALNNWPGEVVYSPFELGNAILTGKRLVESGITGSPVIDTFTMCLPQDDSNGRMSWDQTAALAAVRPDCGLFEMTRGTNVIDEHGVNTWTPDPNGKDLMMKLVVAPEVAAEYLERLMLHQPVQKQ